MTPLPLTVSAWCDVTAWITVSASEAFLFNTADLHLTFNPCYNSI